MAVHNACTLAREVPGNPRQNGEVQADDKGP
jgi:hypothetical protein